MVDWTGQEAAETDVRGYFLCCPLCGDDKIGVNIVSLTNGGRDTLSCYACGAKWHLYLKSFSATLSWAKLELCSADGKGRELLRKKINKEEWKKMALDARANHMMNRTLDDQNRKYNQDREIIREKEVIVKIRCHYCKHLYNETLDKCPHCGGGA